MLDLGLFKLDHVSSPDQHADTGTADRVAPVIQKYGQYQLYGMGATYC